jgi:hypothetical protein
MKLSFPSKLIVWAVLLVAWFAQSLAVGNVLNADGVSYLDIAYSCVAGNWHALVNAYWSPGFPFLLALCIKLFHVTPYYEPLAIHLFAVVSLIVALICFEYFMAVLLKIRNSETIPRGSGQTPLSDRTIQLLGYTLFFWVTTFLTTPYLEQPDILVLIIFLLASALCAQLTLSSSAQPAWRYALFGLVLGLSYLIKAVMFPISFAFIAALFFTKDRFRRLPAILLTTAVFIAVSAPFIYAPSRSKGHFTYGDAGAVNYLHIMGDDADINTGPQPFSLAHPQPAAAPHISEFLNKIDLGTYGPWTDPSSDYKGTRPHFHLARQINRIHVVLSYYFELYIEQLGVLFAGLLAIVLFSPPFRLFAKRFWRLAPLWFPAIAGLALYSLVRIEGRMLAGITITLFAAVITALQIQDSDFARAVVSKITIAVGLVLLAVIIYNLSHQIGPLARKSAYPDWQVATTLHQLGVSPGERVSHMGDTLSDHAWAHLARVKLVAAIPEVDVPTFWAADQSQRLEALRWLAATGAKVLVTRGVPTTALSMGWQKIGDTDYYVLQLPAPTLP